MGCRFEITQFLLICVRRRQGKFLPSRHSYSVCRLPQKDEVTNGRRCNPAWRQRLAGTAGVEALSICQPPGGVSILIPSRCFSSATIRRTSARSAAAS